MSRLAWFDAVKEAGRAGMQTLIVFILGMLAGAGTLAFVVFRIFGTTIP